MIAKRIISKLIVGTLIPPAQRLSVPQFSFSGFSLVEVTLAMGVAGFCLLAIVGLLPAGLTSNRNSSALSAAANIAQAIVADLHSTKCAGNNDSSPQYAIRFSAAGAQVTYFSDDGCLTSSPPAGGYQATTTINTNSIPASITIKITWPALISPASASDAFEITTVIDR